MTEGERVHDTGVRYEIDGPVATITFDRPEKLNALSFAMADEFIGLVDRAGADPAVRVIVVQGAGRAFTSGVDIDDRVDVQNPAGRTIDADRAEIAHAAGRWMQLWSCPKPVIVKAHGLCIGWGIEIAVHADIVLASEDCQFFFPSVRNGSGLPDSAMIVHHLGVQWAKRLLFTAEAVDGRTAERIGLVCQAYPADELDGAVRDLARRMAVLPPAQLTQSKAVVNRSVELMGRAPLQEFAELANATARRDPEVATFGEILARDGRAAAIAWREQRLA
jgi:enoyl-CoA hydratase